MFRSSFLRTYPVILHHPYFIIPHPCLLVPPPFQFFWLHPTHPTICFPKPPLGSVDFVTYREDNSISCSIGSANGRSEISCGIKLFFIFFSTLVSPCRWLSLSYLLPLAHLALTLTLSHSPNFSRGLVCNIIILSTPTHPPAL